ncbi:hypothetical protein [Sedimentitalea nanhaiensis]|uniref:Uncharacterized protein n=1 Tax=Sedimentitalea nanhaiensis TaxID=999627 RepID=A0A1I7E9S5_9RHOB|nr:hypothetical protein [Sedimentitalea nanhaiensis]SFU20690.1 hypothetical protein SAMN05216236_1537 [Sedimentitalea nanhaiensis]
MKDESQKCAKPVHLVDLAEFIDARHATAGKELKIKKGAIKFDVSTDRKNRRAQAMHLCPSWHITFGNSVPQRRQG